LTTNNESEKEEHTQERGVKKKRWSDITKTELVWLGKYNDDGAPRKTGTTKCFYWPEGRLLLNTTARRFE